MTDRIDPRIEGLVRDSAQRRFGPGFADRVMQRVAEQEADALLVMPAQFLRLAAGVGLVALALATYSLFLAKPYEDQSVLEAALGLQPDSAVQVYQLDPLSYFEEVG